MKKRNKAYRPKPISNVGGLLAIDRKMREIELALPLPSSHQTNVEIAYYEAIKAMTAGFAAAYHFDTLVYALNIAQILAERGIGEEHKDLLQPALAAMLRVKERFHATGKFGLDGDGLIAIRDVADLHAEQMRVATLAELDSAVNEMHRRIRENEEVAA